MRKALTIAGSDSGGGAGIQADLKTFSALGVYGTSVITAITAQNTLGVQAAEEVSLPLIAAQIDAVAADIRPDAVKTGMLSSSRIIQTVAGKIKEHGLAPLVVDPVMISKSGHALLAPEAVEALKAELIPLAALITPNLPEAEVLTGMQIRSEEEMREAAVRIAELGCEAVLVKGGHLDADAIDVLYYNDSFETFSARRLPQKHTHGTGCTLSAAITSFLAKGMDLPQAVAEGKKYLTAALAEGLAVGQGIGPVNHFYAFWSKDT